MWVKICGLTSAAEAGSACEAGADALGVNFFRGSPRFCSREAAREIVMAVPRSVTVFGVFVGLERRRIMEYVEEVGLGGVQLHGGEDPQEAEGWELPVIRAVAVHSRDIAEAALDTAHGHRVLLEGPGGGGSGSGWSWDLVQGLPLGEALVAGGLRPDNVAEVVRSLEPWGVDAASGVESAPGVKDTGLVREFIANAKSAR